MSVSYTHLDVYKRQGLGSAVAAALSEACPVPMRYVGMNDCFGQSGDAADLMKYYGMTPENTIAKVKELL